MFGHSFTLEANSQKQNLLWMLALLKICLLEAPFVKVLKSN